MGNDNKLKAVIITGMSGAGKTHAADGFEDHGYYCIDNRPPSLIKNFVELVSNPGNEQTKAAFVVDIRSEEFFLDLNGTLEYLDNDAEIEYIILFMEASDATLMRRFNETRRMHPLADGAASREVISRERAMLSDIRKRADYIIDTTNLKVSQFNAEMSNIFEGKKDRRRQFAINIMSFGYKYGLPNESDVILDMRFIPNPFYVKSLRKLTGNNKKVSSYIMRHDVSKNFVNQICEMINRLVPSFLKEGKNHLNISFGCTGGQHRSVAIANQVYQQLREDGYRLTLNHREL